jgi:glucan biosynthesis protein C
MKNQRIYFLDIVRAVTMLLGIPFHIAIAYTVHAHLNVWAIIDNSNSLILDFFCFFIQTFRMPVFFLLAGYMGHFIYQKNPTKYLENRFKRIALPFLVFSFLLLPGVKALWIVGENPEWLANFELKKIFQYTVSTYFETKSLITPRSPVNFGHLWFLMYLYLFSILSFFWAPFVKSWNIKKAALTLFLLSFLVQLAMPGVWLETPFIWYPRALLSLYYLSFFLFGWVLFLDDFFEKTLPGLSFYWHGLFVVISFLRIYYQTEINHFPIFSPVLVKFAMSISTWYLLYLSFFLAQKIKKVSTIVYKLSDGSYLFYVLHLPIVVFLQIVFFPLELHWIIKFVTINIVTMIILLWIYQTKLNQQVIGPFLKGKLPNFVFDKN